MRFIRRTVRISSLAALVTLLPLHAQDSREIDGAIQAAQAARNPELLEKNAARFEGEFHYDSARKLLDAALNLRGQVSGDQSVDYGLALLKLGAVERKTGFGKEAAAHYSKAVHLLPGRPETAPVFLYLGITSIGKKDFVSAVANLERARSLDPTLSGPVVMWTGLMQERQGQLDLAETSYKSALAVEGADSIERAETLTLYRRFLEQHSREAEALALQAPESAARNARPTRPPVSVPPPSALPRPLTEPKTMPSPLPTGGVFRVGGGVTQPSVIYKVDPAYSEEARVAKYSATVLLQLVVGADGTPQNIKVVRRAGFGLDDCAMTTIAKWQFKPGQKDGNPVPVFATIEVNFRLL